MSLHPQLAGRGLCPGPRTDTESRVGAKQDCVTSSGFMLDLPCVLSYSAESGERLFK